MKPILFETISRAKYDALSDSDKLKKNWQIKEVDGTITKVISGLEGGGSSGGEGIFFAEYEMTEQGFKQINGTFNDIIAAYNNGKEIIATFSMLDEGVTNTYFFSCLGFYNSTNEKSFSYGLPAKFGSIMFEHKVVDEVESCILNENRILPEVTYYDKGKVLMVNNDGDWDKAEAPSSNNDFVVTYTGESGMTADKTFAEIKNAYDAGKNISAFVNGILLLPLSAIGMFNDEINNFKFSTLDIDDETVTALCISHTAATGGSQETIVGYGHELTIAQS